MEIEKTVLRKYVKENKSMNLIARELGISRSQTVVRILKENKVKIRSNQKSSIYKIKKGVKHE